MAESQYSPSARRKISRHIRKHKKEGMPQRQAVAAAMSEARREGKKVPRRNASKPKKARGGSKAQKKRAGHKGGKATARKRRS